MGAKFVELKKRCLANMTGKNIKIVLNFLCSIALKDKLEAHTFLPSFDNEISRLCQEKLLRSRIFATMII